MRLKALKLLLLAGLLLTLCSCSSGTGSGSLTITAAKFPEYDWARHILGNDSPVQLTLLIDNGTDPHSYQPTASDVLTARSCSLLIYGGGESEEWIRDIAEALPENGPVVLELIPTLGERLLNTVYTEGMQIREEEDETDEHIWLSLRNAQICCQAICDSICRLDPENAAVYQCNLAEYLAELDALDQAYMQTAGSGRINTILVADRFAFRYLISDYGLNAYAAFPGCSAESGASFGTMIFLADKVSELSLQVILIPDGSDGRIGRSLAENAGLGKDAVLTLNSMQGISYEQAQNTDYLTIMREDLEILRTALQ